MSHNGLPLPIQPPVANTTAHNAVQAQRQSIQGAAYLGRPELRQSQRFPFPFPERRYLGSIQGRHEHAHKALHLPPIQTSPAHYDTRHTNDRLAIADIPYASQEPTEQRLTSPKRDFRHPLYSSQTFGTHFARQDNGSVSDARRRLDRISSPPAAPSRPISSPRPSERTGSEVASSKRHVHAWLPNGDGYVHSPPDTAGSFEKGPQSGSSEPSPSVQSTSFYTSTSTPTPTMTASQPPPLDYNLSIRQQPIAARACGFGERDRRVIDPPPILELKITAKETGAPEQDANAMLAVHCTLLVAEGNSNEAAIDTTLTDVPSARRLMGTLVASPYQAKDEFSTAGTFFVFSDLSCRSPGTYKLRFKMLRVDPTRMFEGARHLASIETDNFTVYTAKDFPGMRASTALLTALREQGLTVGLKKGTEARISKGRKRQQSESSAEGGGSESDNEDAADNGLGRDRSIDNTKPKAKVKRKGRR